MVFLRQKMPPYVYEFTIEHVQRIYETWRNVLRSVNRFSTDADRKFVYLSHPALCTPQPKIS